jgi:ABC-type nickel/cobalt efflux system permease component RcnA
MLRKAVAALVGTVAIVLATAGTAGAHPLGNFTTNHHAEVVLSGDRAYVRYVLDLAEIPTFQARGRVAAKGRDSYAAGLRATIVDGLALTVDGERRTLAPVRQRLRFPEGTAGLRTTHFEVVLDGGAVTAGELHDVALRDDVLAGRLGWREIVVRADSNSRIVSATVPATSVSDRLRSYPKELLSTPLDVRRAGARFTAGYDAVPPSLGDVRPAVASASDGGFAALVERQELTLGVVLVSLAVALFWGAAHALTPGHGKAIVAAYLVGTRGRARDAVALGAIVTVTHTIGVFALGLVTLGLSSFIVPQDLYPWLNLASALLVVAVGVTVFRQRILAALSPGPPHGHGHSHDHDHDHGHHRHHEGMTEEEHARAHLPAPGSGFRGLLAVGISGGLLPCPTALVVLLAAISLHRVAFGLVLIVAFSVGLAAVISGIGLLAIGARRTFGRMSFDGRAVRALPTVSALVILVVGVAMTARALPAIA